MSTRQRRTNNSISLFPFLAVLVCAMGALIFLLVVTTRQIRMQSVARVQETPRDAPVDVSTEPPVHSFQPAPAYETAPEDDHERRLADLVAQWRQRTASLTARRDQQRATLARQASQLAAAGADLDQMQATLEELESRRRQLAAQAQNGERNGAELDREATEIERLLADLKKRLQQKEHETRMARTRFAFVPFDGQSGTTRRPILIDCTSRGLRILPEDILVTAADLQGFTSAYNPLLSGMKALTDYWKAKDKSLPREEQAGEPYVLLLVRPGGTVAFYVARSLLQSLKQPYGYELVEDDWELSLPEADPAAQLVCREAMETLLAERTLVLGQVQGGGSAGSGSLNRSGGSEFQLSDVSEPGSGGSDSSGLVGAGTGLAGFQRAVERRNQTLAKPAPAGASALPEWAQSPSARQGEGVPADSLQASERTPHSSTNGAIGAGDQPGAAESAELAVGSGKLGSGTHGGATGTQPGSSATLSGPGTEPQRTNPASSASTTGSSSFAPRSAFPTPQSNATRASSTEADLSDLPEEDDPFPKFGSRKQSSDSEYRPRARRWGRSTQRASIGFERQLTIRADSDRLTIAGERIIAAGRGETRRELVEQVVWSIDEAARSWGDPPEGFYWVPKVKFIVSPGGNQHYERLNGALREWGLASTVEHTLEAGSPGSPQLR